MIELKHEFEKRLEKSFLGKMKSIWDQLLTIRRKELYNQDSTTSHIILCALIHVICHEYQAENRFL